MGKRHAAGVGYSITIEENQMKEWISSLHWIVLIAGLVVLLPIAIVMFMLLWNSTIPGITGWTEIDFVQSFAIILLGKFLTD